MTDYLEKCSSIIVFSRDASKHSILSALYGDKLRYGPCWFDPDSIVVGWGDEPHIIEAKSYSRENNLKYIHLEDGFINSLKIGPDKSKLFSFVADENATYCDPDRPSDLEKILENYDFDSAPELLQWASHAMGLICKFNISKSNTSDQNKDYNLLPGKKIVILPAENNDHANSCLSIEMLDCAINENPDLDIYIALSSNDEKKNTSSNLKLLKEKNCKIIYHDENTISLLKNFDKVYTNASLMGFEALILGKEVICFGVPFYAGWGLTDDRVKSSRRKRKLTLEEVFAGAYLLYPKYFNPYTQQKSDIIDVIYAINKYREIEQANRGKLNFFGFTKWKQRSFHYFFKSFYPNKICYRRGAKSYKKLLGRKSKILIGNKKYTDVDLKGRNGARVYNVEDGFIRSVSIGSVCHARPYSIVVDSRGIHYIPTRESDLEYILNNYDFGQDNCLLERAKIIRKRILEARLSKYNILGHEEIQIDRSNFDKVILIPGQVENDKSIYYGGCNMVYKELIPLVRKENPNSYIIYKPHPDLLLGHRKGIIEEKYVYKYCNKIIKNQSIDSCLKYADEVHTITSLCGFDALLRKIKVFTYGKPFYAGWGLTVDRQKLERRTRKLTLIELIVGALILYPRYINPITDELCEVETVIDEIEKEQRSCFDSKTHTLKLRFRMFCYKLLNKIIRL